MINKQKVNNKHFKYQLKLKILIIEAILKIEINSEQYRLF